MNGGYGARSEAADFNMGFRSAPIAALPMKPIAALPMKKTKLADPGRSGSSFIFPMLRPLGAIPA